MSKKLTPWFHSDRQNPVRPGVYIATVKRNDRFYRLWDGKHWYYGDYFSPDEALRKAVKYGKWHADLSPLYWRGLAKEPK